MRFSRSVFVRDIIPNRFLIASALFRMRIQKLACLFVDFAMPFGKALANFASNLGNLEIAARCIVDRVPESAQRTASS